MTKIRTFADVLEAAGTRPLSSSGQSVKNSYAMKFANAMAVLVANGLRNRFPKIKPDESGEGIESPSQAVRGLKKLDVNFGTTQAGLGLGISLKSVHSRDKNETTGFTHNLKRNDEELRVEAAGYHQRQPYAVLIAIVTLPIETCDDGSAKKASSFGKWVEYLWALSGRDQPNDPPEKFEAVYIGLYDPESAELRFFDVRVPPPRNGRPPKSDLMSFEDIVEKIVHIFDIRNGKGFRWADGSLARSTGDESV